MTILLFTGSSELGVATACSAWALHAAASGQRTLLLSMGPQHCAPVLLEVPASATPQPVAPQLDLLALDTLAELAAAWERGRPRLPAQLAGIAGDELPLLPGMELLFGLLRLRDLAPQYDLVVVDAGPPPPLLRALALADSLRWLVRLLLGLDRGPGRSQASQTHAALPTSLLPTELRNGVQDLRVEAEQTRAGLLDPATTSAPYVLRPDPAGLAEARVAVPALQLHGLAVPALLLGPGLPADVADQRLAAQAARAAAVAEEARALWASRTLHDLTLADPFAGQAALRDLGAHLAAHPPGPTAAPVTWQHGGTPAVAIDLPGLPKGALKLTISGDELIVQIGPYRRHILLPDTLRGISAIRATREGDTLVVRRREA